MILKIYKSKGKAVEVTVNSKEKNSKDFGLDFVQEFGLCINILYIYHFFYCTYRVYLCAVYVPIS